MRIRYTILLLLIVGLAYVLKTFVPALEPYPALILPSGASLLELENGIVQIDARTIMAKTDDGNWKRIDPEKFMEPIPVHYMYPLMARQFGLSVDSLRTLRTRVIPEIQILDRTFSEQELAQTRGWIRFKLREQHFQEEYLKIRLSQKKVDTSTNEILGDEITEEYVIRLY